jgi:micrococcal nuclease
MRTVLLIVLMLCAPLAHAAEYVGPAVAVEDGDTFTIHAQSRNIKVRLCGVDSPERASKKRPKERAAYQAAKDALTALVLGKVVRCVQVGPNAGTPCDRRSRPRSRDRIVAQCFIGEKLDQDIAPEMLRRGKACSWSKYDGGYYARLFPDACVRQ